MGEIDAAHICKAAGALRDRAGGEPFLAHAPSYTCAIIPLDDLARTYRPANWESGVVSGAGYAVRRWLGKRRPEQPFFLYLHLMDVHGPYDAPDEDYAAVRESPGLGPARRLTAEEMSRLYDEVLHPAEEVPA